METEIVWWIKICLVDDVMMSPAVFLSFILPCKVLKPLDVVDKVGHFHVRCTATGGGLSGQAGAIRLGLARALEAHEPWWRKELKKGNLGEVGPLSSHELLRKNENANQRSSIDKEFCI